MNRRSNNQILVRVFSVVLLVSLLFSNLRFFGDLPTVHAQKEKQSMPTMLPSGIESLMSKPLYSSSSFSIGDTVQVTTNLNVRVGPGTGYSEITDPDYLVYEYAPQGTIGEVIDGPVSDGSYIWWKVNFGPGEYTGWSVEMYLTEVAQRYDIQWSTAQSNGWKNPLGEGKTLTTSTAYDFDSGIYKETWSARHAGVDIVASENSSIYAIADGTVEYVTRPTNTENMVVIIRHEGTPHGDFFAVYGHVLAIEGLEKGSQVSAGHKIGASKKCGNPAHLHFGINKYKVAQSGWGRTPVEVDPITEDWVDPVDFLNNNTNNHSNNHPPNAEAAVSTSLYGPFYGYDNPLTVTRGEEITLYFYADKDVDGDGLKSHDPDGWDHAENGVSDGGVCEWNLNLEQQNPYFEMRLHDPVSPDACNILFYNSQNPYTFNDEPGIYEYPLLSITDRKGEQSIVSRIRIRVVDGNTSTPTLTLTPTLTRTPSPTPSLTPTDTPTDTPSSTSTGTPTPTQTDTPTPTQTYTPSPIPTNTLTPTQAQTQTYTPPPTSTEIPPDGSWHTPSAAGKAENEWNNPENAFFSDNNYATAHGTYTEQDYYSFDFDIPPNATIEGVEVAVEGHGEIGGSDQISVELWSTSRNPDETPPLGFWGTKNNGQAGWWLLGNGSDSTIVEGGPSDLWGVNWVPSDFSNDNFLLRIKTFSNPDRVYVDQVKAKVYYTISPTNTPTATSTPTSTATGTATPTTTPQPATPTRIPTSTTEPESGWYIQTVDNDGNIGRYSSLVIDDWGYPHISYQDFGNGDLKYAYWDGSTWHIETVDSEGIVGLFTSLELDESGHPHISYYDDTYDDLKYAYWDGTSWQIETVDSTGFVGGYTSLALDGEGYPHISYNDYGNEDLKYAYWDGTFWNIDTIDSNGNVGRDTSIILDGYGNPHISYLDHGNNDLKYTHQDGSGWHFEVVDTAGSVGHWSTLEIDATNYPHISYYDGSNGHLKYASWNGSSWQREIIANEGIEGLYSSIILDSNDHPHISFHEGFNDDLKYAYWDGSQWHIQVVDDSNDVGQWTSIALDTIGYSHISYYDWGNSNLKYAYQEEIPEQTETPSSTPTNTPTQVPTPNETPSPTPTDTPTPTSTYTPIPTSTFTPTPTPTYTPSPTSTNTPTYTSTSTPSLTPTDTPTPTSTVSPSITLVSFTATIEGLDVKIEWETASEFDLSGFYVLRSLSLDGNYSRISGFIPGEGDSIVGTTYEFIDTNVNSGTNYYYKLEDIDINAVSTFHGPVAVGSTTQTPTPTIVESGTPTRTPTFTPTPTSTFTPSPTPTNTPEQSFCSNVTEIPNEECDALVTLYNSTNGDNWNNNDGWLVTDTPCDWYGVTCTAGHVVRLDLDWNELSRNIPPELGNLSNLEYLRLSGNQLSGNIPSELGNLSNLTDLDLDWNELSGNIPPELGNLSNLAHLNLSSNNLNGNIPTELSNLSHLERLSLYGNDLSGNIPPELGNLTNVVSIRLEGNTLCGEIPSDLGNLSNLAYLDLGDNQLTGSIPAELGNLFTNSELQELQDLGNTTPTGGGGGWLFLDLSNNQLSGHIPSELGNMTKLHMLNLAGNKLTGPIPEVIGNLVNLYFLQLDRNALSGEIPSSITNLTQLETTWETDLGYNMLYSTNPSVIVFLDVKDFDWDSSQTIPPSNVEVAEVGETSVKLSWIPVLYLGHSGYYEIGYATTEGGPYTIYGQTKDKSISEYVVNGLSPDTTYYFVVRTFTPAHGAADMPAHEPQQNDLLSAYSVEASVTTGTTKPEINVKGNGRSIMDGDMLPSTIDNTDFGTINFQDGTITHTFVVENTGNLDLTITLPISVTGTNPGDFNITNSPASLISPGGSTSFTLEFDPSDIGDIEAVISITNNDENENPYEFAVQGNGGIPPIERNALEALYNSTNGENWWNNDGWMDPDISPCEWYGITCSNDHVVKIQLRWNDLEGYIPLELSNLSNLEELSLGGNELAGSMPAELGNLSNLANLDLSYNQLSGSIPPELGNLSNLEYLNLSENQLSGNIPSELGNLSNLGVLSLYGNDLSGSIPPELGNLSNLEELMLGYNQLSGSIPPDLGNLSNLRRLSLHGNNLSGSIPSELGNLSNLTKIELQNNQLNDSIPSELGNLSNLEMLILAGNELSGSIPSELGSLTNLFYLVLSNNQLTGEIPTELGNLFTSVSLGNQQDIGDPHPMGGGGGGPILDLSNNQLSGHIPSELGNMENLSWLGLAGNKLTGTIPTEIGQLSNLQILQLDRNALSGEIPSTITNLTNLRTVWETDLGYNMIYSTNSAVIDFLDVKDFDWDISQTIPPSDVQITMVGQSSLKLSWTPIPYLGHGGYYEISYSTIKGGPYTLHGQTQDKSVSEYIVDGLSPDTTYYFVVRTFTPAHGAADMPAHEPQQNDLLSDPSGEVSVKTSSFSILQTDDYNVAPGDNVVVSIEALDLPSSGLGAATVEVHYDPSILEIVNCVVDPDGRFDFGNCNKDYENDGRALDIVRFNLTSLTGIPGNELLANITFKAIGIAGEVSVVDIVKVTFADTDGEPISVNDQDGSVSLFFQGNVSGDGNIDVIDGMFILQFDVGLRGGSSQYPPPQGSMFTPACDVNHDGVCNIVDALFILQCDIGIHNVFCPAEGQGTTGIIKQNNHSPGVLGEYPSVEDSASISAGTAEVSSGETVDISVEANFTSDNLGAATIDVSYDPLVANAIACTANPNSDFDYGYCNPNYDNDGVNPDIVRFNLTSLTGLENGLLLANITFEGVGNPGDSSVLNVVPIIVTDASGVSVPVADQDGEIEISSAGGVGANVIYLPIIQVGP